MLTNCVWERFRATAAPMASQQQQLRLCNCNKCDGARRVALALGTTNRKDIAARLAVLAWKPEPPPGSDADLGADTEPAA